MNGRWRKTIGLSLALSLLVPLAGWSSTRKGGAVPVSKRHVIAIRGFAFHPAELTVARGDTVVWVNRDIVPHTVTTDRETWDSGELQTDETWAWVAMGEDEMSYLCAYHPSMRGIVTVAAAPEREPATANTP